MKTLFKGLEINEKDNALTAAGKGLVEGTISAGVFWLTLGGMVIVAGKVVQEFDKKKVETKEEEAGE